VKSRTITAAITFGEAPATNGARRFFAEVVVDGERFISAKAVECRDALTDGQIHYTEQRCAMEAIAQAVLHRQMATT
jgi:hypothetical protein